MFDFWIDGQSGAARSGSLTLPHGTVETPVFMPVGTQATVRTLSPADLKAVGAQIVLANTYHLHVRPGEDVIAQLGGLHKFMAWERPLLTDSGGFQVFSLEGFRRVDEDGVEFQSHVDGGRRKLTPETAIDIQAKLGSDITMAFDHVIPGGADEATARDALDRTLRWLARCKKRHDELKTNDGPSSRVGRCLRSGRRASIASWNWVPGPASPLAASPWASPKTRCTPRSTCWKRVCPPPFPVILWASGFRRISSRQWSEASTCSTAWRPRAAGATARHSPQRAR